MPNQPRADNPNRVVRMDDALWAQVRRVAEVDGTTPSEVVRRALRLYVGVGVSGPGRSPRP